MRFNQKTKKQMVDEELQKYNQLMKKIGRKPVTAKSTRRKSIRVSSRNVVSTTRTDDQYRNPSLPSTSNKVIHSTGKADFVLAFDRGQESQSTIDAIKEKANSTAPLYSKGAYQYVTPKTNTTEIGRKL